MCDLGGLNSIEVRIFGRFWDRFTAQTSPRPVENELWIKFPGQK